MGESVTRGETCYRAAWMCSHGRSRNRFYGQNTPARPGFGGSKIPGQYPSGGSGGLPTQKGRESWA